MRILDTEHQETPCSSKPHLAFGLALLMVLGSCGSPQTTLDSFLGQETDKTLPLDELVEGRVVVTQDVSPLFDARATFSTGDWDSPGFTVIAACGDGKYLEDSENLEILVVNSSALTDENIQEAQDGTYQEWLANVDCYKDE